MKHVVEFNRDGYRGWVGPSNAAMCRRGIDELFSIPNTSQKIWLTLSDTEIKGSYLFKFRRSLGGTFILDSTVVVPESLNEYETHSTTFGLDALIIYLMGQYNQFYVKCEYEV